MAVETPNIERKKKFKLGLTMLLVALSLLVTCAQGQSLVEGRVYSNPNTVGAQSAELSLIFYVPEDVSGGSTILITVPEGTRVEEGALAPCSLGGVFEVSQYCQTQGS